MYKGVDYEGGLAFEGANVKGKGKTLFRPKSAFTGMIPSLSRLPQRILFFPPTDSTARKHQQPFTLAKTQFFIQTSDFHSIRTTGRSISYRTNNPVSPSPYFNTFHNVDMYFENLSWDMDSTEDNYIKAKGAAMGQALFESSAFFNADYFMKLMGLDNYHPLTRLKKFAEWYYSNTFPVSEFAKWLENQKSMLPACALIWLTRDLYFMTGPIRRLRSRKK